jgi:hypothetical protein
VRDSYSLIGIRHAHLLSIILRRERREHRVFNKLLQLIPALEDRLMEKSEEEISFMAEQVWTLFMTTRSLLLMGYPIQIQKGASGARSDDTKTLKGAVLDWITPKHQALVPPLSRNLKVNRGFHHEVTGRLLCPAGMNWDDEECVILSSTSHVVLRPSGQNESRSEKRRNSGHR